MADQPSFIEVQKCLSGMSYPARRDDLVQHAEGQGVDQDLLEALRAIPDREYDGPSGVSEEISKVS
ncbi:DUF2795 domain-containing protein [Actinomadura sp. 6N118]|uniref:DUF2795 domain-containing protein n=1 Tax=Actinomadura sp. 6N118 TaxID=3375151 RepID=UPI0037A3B753